MAAPDYSNFPKPMTQAEIDSMEGIVVDPNPLHIDVKVRQTLTSTSCSTLRSYSCFGFACSVYQKLILKNLRFTVPEFARQTRFLYDVK